MSKKDLEDLIRNIQKEERAKATTSVKKSKK